MKRIELLAKWSGGYGDSGSYSGEFYIDDKQYDLLKDYVLNDGIKYTNDIPNEELRLLLYAFEDKLSAEFKNVEKENWDCGLTGDRRDEYNSFDEWWTNYFTEYVYEGIVISEDSLNAV